MTSLKQIIVNAILKVSSDPMYAGRTYALPEDARDDFIKALIAELFPECPDYMVPSAVQASEVAVVEQVAEQVAEQEKDGGGPVAGTKRKLSKEEKEEAKKAKEAEKKAKEEAKEAEKKAKEEAKKAKAEAPAEEKKKPGPKPKPKVETDGPINLEKLNPTQTKKLKTIAEELKVDADKKAFHTYINSLPKAEYDAKTFDDHVRAFLQPTQAAPEEPVLTKCARVEWPEGSGTVYLVDPETQKVYAPRGNINEYVGHVGMLEFEGLEIPDA